MSLRDWFRPAPPLDDGRWLVVDVESSGLNPARDRLLAIAGVAVWLRDRKPLIAPGDSFEIVLRQDQAVHDKSNILLHGIGGGAQRAGIDPAEALGAFERWVGRSPLIAFHAAFDETMIQRAMQAVLGRRLRNPWVDLAHVAEIAQPKAPARALDEWLGLHGIVCAVRHQAAADTFATAELLLKLWPDIAAQRAAPGFRGLREIADQRRWLTGGR
mgnify:CR=1 FL=1